MPEFGGLVLRSMQEIVATGMAHTLFVITFIGFVVGSWKGMRAWRKARDEAMLARAAQQDAIGRVLKHLDNGGSTLVSKVDKSNDLLREHVELANASFRDNANEHRALHERIDNLLTLLVGGVSPRPRRTAERHHQREESDDEPC